MFPTSLSQKNEEGKWIASHLPGWRPSDQFLFEDVMDVSSSSRIQFSACHQSQAVRRGGFIAFTQDIYSIYVGISLYPWLHVPFNNILKFFLFPRVSLISFKCNIYRNWRNRFLFFSTFLSNYTSDGWTRIDLLDRDFIRTGSNFF